MYVFIKKLRVILFKKVLGVRYLGMLLCFCVKKIKNKRGTGRYIKSLLKSLSHLTLGFNEGTLPLSEIIALDTIKTTRISYLRKGSVTIHDNIPLILYKSFSKKKTQQWVFINKKNLKYFKRVIVISKSSALVVARYYSIPINKLQVLFNGNAPLLNERRTFKNVFLIKNYWFFLGTSDYNKNACLASKTLQLLNNEFIMVVGKNFSLKIKNSVNLKFIHDYYLKYFLTNSKASLFLSLYEGFGMPPIEFGFMEKQSIVTSRPSTLEINKKFQIYIDPLSIYELSNVLNSFRGSFGRGYYNYYSFFLWKSRALVTLTKK